MPGFYDIEWTDCFQLSLMQRYLSQDVVNRFFYHSIDYAGELSAIGSYFASAALTKLQPIQSDQLTYLSVIVTKLWGSRDSVEHVITASTGGDTGGPLPAFYGARFRLNPTYTRVRKGRKIFAGITELMTQGDDLAPSYVTPFGNVALWLAGSLVVDSIVFTPVLLSPANTKHVANEITTVASAQYIGWSTQSSRKIGRGS